MSQLTDVHFSILEARQQAALCRDSLNKALDEINGVFAQTQQEQQQILRQRDAYRSLCKEMAEVLYVLWHHDGGSEEQRDRGHALCLEFHKLQSLYVRHEEDPNA